MRDLTPLAEAAHAAGALLIAVFTEVVSLGLVEPPGAMGADIVVGEGQSIGNALSFGGPYVGLFATRQKYVRQMPGRLCGETVDAEGRRGFVLTLVDARAAHPPREGDLQHLHQLRPVRAGLHHPHDAAGRGGPAAAGALNHANAVELADLLAKVPGVTVLNETFFNEFTIRVPGERRRGDRGAGGKGRARRRAGVAAVAGQSRSGRPDHRRRDRGEHGRGSRRLRQALREVL